MSSMLAFTTFQLIMAVAIFAICLLLILIVLVQKGRGGGLASAFGGGGGGGGAFGAKTGDVFTGITVVLAGIYLLLTVFGNYVFRPDTTTTRASVAPAPATQPSQVPMTVPATRVETEGQEAPDGAVPTEEAPNVEAPIEEVLTDEAPGEEQGQLDEPEAAEIEDIPSDVAGDEPTDEAPPADDGMGDGAEPVDEDVP